MKHHKQIAAYKDPARFKYILAGRRGGKSELIVEDIAKSVSIMPPESDIFYIGPTNQMAKETIWNRLDQRFRQNGYKFEPYTSKQVFEFSNKRLVYVIGGEKIRRVRGHRVFKGYLDELAFFESDLNEVWSAIRPALSDLKGKAIVSTTPNGKGTQAYDFYLDSLKKEDWTYHHWYSLDNPGMDPQEIEDAKREMDEKSFKQEYMAAWESYEGLAYYNFDELIHVKKQPPIDDNMPVILHFDFNVNPTTLLIGQKYPNMYRFLKEYSHKNQSTEYTIGKFCEEFKDKAGQWHLKIRGDASGNNRSSNTGFADYYYVQNKLKEYGFSYEYQVKASNPSIVDRVRHVNGYLKNGLGQHRVEFDPSMTDTIRDLSSQETDGRHPSDKNNLGHKADALGYGIYWDWLTTRDDKPKSSTTFL